MLHNIIDVDLSLIDPSPTNPRKYFNETKLQELAGSIKAVGVIQAITLRKHPKKDGRYELVCGERRTRASRLAEMKTIPAQVKELTDDQVQELQFIENIEREDVHPMDEAVTFKAMIENKKHPWTMEDIAAKINKPVSYVAQRMQLNSLLPALQKEFWDGKFLIGHAILFARLAEADQKECVKNHNVFYDKEYQSVKKVAEHIEVNILQKLSSAPFKKDDAELLPAAGACITCVKRTGSNLALFPEMKNDDRCTNRKCFQNKCEAFLLKETEKILTESPEIFLMHDYQGFSAAIKKLAEKYKVHILNYRDNGIIEYKSDGYSPIKVFWVGGSKAGKTQTMYKRMSGKAKIATKIAAGEKLTVDDIDTQIAGIKERLKRGVELDAEKVWASVSDTIKDVSKIKPEVLTNGIPGQEEKNAFAYALLTNIPYHYQKPAAEILGIKGTYFLGKDVAGKMEGISDVQLFFLLRLFTLSKLDEGVSHEASAKPMLLMKMLQTDLYFKNDITALISDQAEVKEKRELNAKKKIEALEKQKKELKPKKEKAVPAVKKKSPKANKKAA